MAKVLGTRRSGGVREGQVIPDSPRMNSAQECHEQVSDAKRVSGLVASAAQVSSEGRGGWRLAPGAQVDPCWHGWGWGSPIFTPIFLGKVLWSHLGSGYATILLQTKNV